MTTPPNENEGAAASAAAPETPQTADAGPGSLPESDPGAGIGPPPIVGDLDDRRRLRGWSLWAAAAVVATVVALAGIALADGGDDSDGGVASMDGTSREVDDLGGAGGATPVDDSEFQDALLEYTECMREEGVDMPDPEFQDGGGAVVIENGDDGGRQLSPGPDDEAFAAAEEKCGDILEDAHGDMAPPDPDEIAEMRDRLVEMAECMRQRGYDMPDPVVSENGGIEIAMRGRPDGGGDAEQFEKDQAECDAEAGLDHGPGQVSGTPGEDQ